MVCCWVQVKGAGESFALGTADRLLLGTIIGPDKSIMLGVDEGSEVGRDGDLLLGADEAFKLGTADGLLLRTALGVDECIILSVDEGIEL